MNWFDNIRNRKELKAEFRRLAKIHHPDHGGDAAIMGEIIGQYEALAKKLPEEERETMAAPAPRRFHCAYRPTTAGGDNPTTPRLAAPWFSHRQICTMAKMLHTYARADCDIQAFYWKICGFMDPGQSLPYRDYLLTPKIARASLKFLRDEVMRHVWKNELCLLVREAEKALA